MTDIHTPEQERLLAATKAWMEALLAQNAELLKALKEIAGYSVSSSPHAQKCVELARAAIERAKS